MNLQTMQRLISEHFGGLVIIIDDSSAMSRHSTLIAGILDMFTQACSFDVYFVNHRSGLEGPNGQAPDGFYLRTAHDGKSVIEALNNPPETTPTGGTVTRILDGYTKQYRQDPSLKPLHLIVFTDEKTSSKTLKKEAGAAHAAVSTEVVIVEIDDNVAASVVVEEIVRGMSDMIKRRRLSGPGC